jgi:hypothetical protein
MDWLFVCTFNWHWHADSGNPIKNIKRPIDYITHLSHLGPHLKIYFDIHFIPFWGHNTLLRQMIFTNLNLHYVQKPSFKFLSKNIWNGFPYCGPIFPYPPTHPPVGYMYYLIIEEKYYWRNCIILCIISILALTAGNLISTKGARRVWPVSRGCLLLRGTWSYLRICRRSVLPYTPFCNCLLDYDYVLHIVNFAILYLIHFILYCVTNFPCKCKLFGLNSSYKKFFPIFPIVAPPDLLGHGFNKLDSRQCQIASM